MIWSSSTSIVKTCRCFSRREAVLLVGLKAPPACSPARSASAAPQPRARCDQAGGDPVFEGPHWRTSPGTCWPRRAAHARPALGAGRRFDARRARWRPASRWPSRALRRRRSGLLDARLHQPGLTLQLVETVQHRHVVDLLATVAVVGVEVHPAVAVPEDVPCSGHRLKYRSMIAVSEKASASTEWRTRRPCRCDGGGDPPPGPPWGPLRSFESWSCRRPPRISSPCFRRAPSRRLENRSGRSPPTSSGAR